MEKRAWDSQVTFERGRSTLPELTPGERIFGTIEAELWDLGLIGFLLRRRERLVVTSHRILQYSNDFISTRLRCLELAKIELIEVGSKLNLIQFIVGMVLLLSTLFLLIGAIFRPGETGRLLIICGLFSALSGLFVLLTAWKKVLQASGAGYRSTVSLPLASIGVNDSKSFVDLVSGAIRNLSKAAEPPPLPLSREAAEKVAQPLNSGEPRFKKSLAAQTSSKQIRQEPGGTPNHSSKGDTTPDKTSTRARQMYIE